MNRRQFLKLTSKVLFAAAIPITAVSEPILIPKIAKVAELNCDISIKIFYNKLLLSRRKPKLIHNRFTEQGMVLKGQPIVWRRWAKLPELSELLNEGVMPTNLWA